MNAENKPRAFNSLADAMADIARRREAEARQSRVSIGSYIAVCRHLGASTLEGRGAPLPTTVTSQNRRTYAPRRILDIALASVGVFLLCPLMVVIAAAIGLGSGSWPVLVRDSRTGLYMFRTTYGSDMRMTGLGWFLEQSGLDQLPQLISVLKGEVSLVAGLSPSRES